MLLREIIFRHRLGIALALALVAVENVAWIAEPALFGPLLDHMIDRAAKVPGALVMPSLLLWIAVFGVNTGAGSLRRSVEPRIYLRLFVEIAGEVTERARRIRLDPSVAAARITLSREFIEFLHYRAPEAFEQLIAIMGALVGMAIYDLRIAAICFMVVFPILLVKRGYDRRVTALQTELHDGLEEAVEVARSLDTARVRAHYQALAKPQQRIADFGAFAFGSVRISLLVIFLAVLKVAIDLDDFTTGRLYTIVSYLWTFITSTEYLPELLESWSSLKEISNRLRAQEV
jgi:ABC-type multidrug transport system fused ATPase/permease subunit